MGDSHAALFGQNCYLPGMIKTTYGTGSSVMMNIGEKPVFSGSGIVTSIGWVSTGETVYVLEGNINSTGKTIEWITENAELLSSPKESGTIASKLPDNGGVYFVPAFTGLSAPYWNNDARAIITGLTLSSRKEHIIRAAEESIVYQINDVITLMRECSGSSIADIRVDGGPTRDAFLMQFQADISNAKVIVPAVEELSALGSANMAGLATGFWKNRNEITKNRTVLKEYVPGMDLSKRQQYIQGWHKAVNRAVL
jgi:glycerol kinase